MFPRRHCAASFARCCRVIIEAVTKKKKPTSRTHVRTFPECRHSMAIPLGQTREYTSARLVTRYYLLVRGRRVILCLTWTNLHCMTCIDSLHRVCTRYSTWAMRSVSQSCTKKAGSIWTWMWSSCARCTASEMQSELWISWQSRWSKAMYSSSIKDILYCRFIWGLWNRPTEETTGPFIGPTELTRALRYFCNVSCLNVPEFAIEILSLMVGFHSTRFIFDDSIDIIHLDAACRNRTRFTWNLIFLLAYFQGEIDTFRWVWRALLLP